MSEMEGRETAGESEGESEGLFGKVLGYAGEAAHLLHYPAEVMAHQAAHHVGHLKELATPFEEAVWPGGMMGDTKLAPEMVEPWIDGLRSQGRIGEIPTEAFNPSMSQWGQIARADAGAAENAAAELAPAASKAGALHNVGLGLSGVASVAAGYEEYKDSAAQTQTGKVVDGALGGAANFAMMNLPKGAPPLALIDAGMGLVGSGLSWGGDKLGVGAMHDSGEFLKHNRPGHSLAAGLGGAVTAAEGMITGDSTGMEKWNKESLDGKHGVILQGFSNIGNMMANSKAMDKVFDWMLD